MPDNTPRLYFLRGDDPARFKQVLGSFRTSMGDVDLADLNTTRLDGDSLWTLEALFSDAMTVPFLAPRRMVIVEKARDFLGRLNPDQQTRMLSLLGDLPQTTALVLLVEDSLVRKKREVYWENARKYLWILNWIEQNRDVGAIVDCSLPDEEEMPGWIIKRAKELGGAIRPDAAYLLAGYVGNDTLRAQNELDKLISYAGAGKTVTSEDVVLLTAQDKEGNIFALTDAIGERNSNKAMQQFRLLTETSDVIEISAMIHRQFRQLIQAREIIDEGGRQAEVERELKVLPFLAEKLTAQARRFSMAQLLDIFNRLLEIDLDMKSGGLAGDTAYELLIAELTR